MRQRQAKFAIGDSVEHKIYGFRGVVFDVDPEFDNTEEWWQSIPADVRPSKDQPFYHLFAVQSDNSNPYIAYVSEQNLTAANPEDPIDHPGIGEYFAGQQGNGQYIPNNSVVN
ncbi:heat shock protein HspQ [Curvivirga aplysinae]|uniref:heat shock protein HspQ n=1 Tax=Curvivirga aplysinae TaxID=2529852 RepID=UPI0012BC5332|nr:heat shock protein HspQ [Curvivirga aplysinae]MTI10822.1 heat shock protein HspQ [Curvivirga aplysinae]